jgi:hypothetical protein
MEKIIGIVLISSVRTGQSSVEIGHEMPAES